jgi:predicted double-glycine peptidase
MRRPSAIPALLAAAVALAPRQVAAASRDHVRSFLELRRDRVVRQGWDLSCGAAALGTVLTYELGDPVGEPEIVKALLAGADAARIKARGGFSLLDLKRYAQARGHAAAGYGNLDLWSLAALGVAIVPTQGPAGPHFMVFRGIVDGRVLLADPAYGNRTLPRERFEAMWSPRVAFVVRASGTSLPPGDDRTLATLVPPRVVREAIGVRP